MLLAGSGDSPVRGALRIATMAVHLRLHAAPPFQAIADGRLERSAYAQLLGRIHAFHVLIERQAGRSLAGLLPSQRIALLEADLAALGASPAPLPSWSPPAGAAAALGGLYVAQGSLMGGKLIHRQLDYLFGTGLQGRRYFRGSDADARRWRALCLRLEQEGAAPGATAAMIAGAQDAFCLFGRCVEDMVLA